MRLWLFAVGLCLAFVAGCAGEEEQPQEQPKGPAGVQRYAVDVDGPSPEGKNLQFSAYFPGSVKVRPGDSVVFSNRSNQAPHTITFGVTPDRSNGPLPITAQGQINPVVFGPCATESEPSPKLDACPTPAKPGEPLPAYAGSGYWNSGILSPTVSGAPANPNAPPKDVRIKFDASIAPGRYTYLCLLHGLMAGTIEVVDDDADRLSSEAVSKAGREAFQRARTSVQEIPEPTASEGTVTAGWGDKVVAVNRFSPQKLSINVGETVSWKPGSPYEPHTVTFESPFESPEEEGVAVPGGVTPGGRYAGGFAHSGIFGPSPFPAGSYSLTFTRAGNYPYICVLHPGMVGEVEVK
jgi:plastocyanin